MIVKELFTKYSSTKVAPVNLRLPMVFMIVVYKIKLIKEEFTNDSILYLFKIFY
jgi:hypothetical protein